MLKIGQRRSLCLLVGALCIVAFMATLYVSTNKPLWGLLLLLASIVLYGAAMICFIAAFWDELSDFGSS